ncbi:FAD dependent oxidoreductase [Daldinia caldariorum]|uniref:FAD dependent oxidoreductase n=1 Tax=Daldinia caldariorum TaxID=326644 RepID=UPI0020072CF5|nr:FAD dependent oxidoreductase [Daldinia caldariorum]KAI1473015.1 FAD dependent oxidoreductase [Daldinia caldariorum]
MLASTGTLPMADVLSCPTPVLHDVNFDTDMNPKRDIPSSILIIGAGVFGLSTALALAKRPEFASSSITVLDRSPEPGVFPSRDASSIDSSRIIRADYADPVYASLASEAQVHWRQTDPASLGGEGRYTESGFILGADSEPLVRDDGSPTGLAYAKKSWVNAMALAHKEGRPLNSIRVLKNSWSIGMISGTGGEFAYWGYMNTASGWADAEASMKWFYERVAETGRVTFVNGKAESLETDESSRRVTGARLKDGTTLSADLVVVAAGAWTPTLVDLTSQVVATGQVLGYMDITEEEQKRLDKIPVMLNVSTGLFVIPPRNRVLKIARHAYGYLNPKPVSKPPLGVPGSKAPELISQPYTHLDDASLSIPTDAEKTLREGLQKIIPWPELKDRPFSRTRLCWYTDTVTGDWLIDYHPYWQGLFVATGGSGHAFKFLPVIGDKIVDTITGKCSEELRRKWQWKFTGNTEIIATEEGSRGGQPGAILENEMKKIN